MTFLDLGQSPVIVIAVIQIKIMLTTRLVWFVLRGYRDVAAIDDLGPAIEGVGVEGHVISAAKSNSA